MKDIAEMTYSEFTLLLSADVDDRFELILDYDDFQIFEDKQTGRYFYLECGENDASEFFEVECVARLIYSTIHDIDIPNGKSTGFYMRDLFDCDVCGEWVNDDNIQYLWFKRIISRTRIMVPIQNVPVNCNFYWDAKMCFGGFVTAQNEGFTTITDTGCDGNTYTHRQISRDTNVYIENEIPKMEQLDYNDLQPFSELNPCPLCGSTDVSVVYDKTTDDFFVCCNECKYDTSECGSQTAAEDLWNNQD